MNESDLYYTAGFLDGEGSIMLSIVNKGKHRSPSVSISSTTPEIIVYLKETFGGHVVSHKIYQEHHKPAQSWRLQYNAAYDFIKMIAPYLKEPAKKRRAELIINDYKRLTPRNGKYTEQMLIERQAFEDEFFND